MEKFKVPTGTSYERAFEMVSFELNRLRERLDVLELSSKQTQTIKGCRCDATYTGQHANYCDLYGHRV